MFSLARRTTTLARRATTTPSIAPFTTTKKTTPPFPTPTPTPTPTPEEGDNNNEGVFSMIKQIFIDAKFLYGPNSELEQLRAKRIESQRITAELKEINKRMDAEHDRIRLESLLHFKQQLEGLKEQADAGMEDPDDDKTKI